jgi:Uma2 family endonuclease
MATVITAGPDTALRVPCTWRGYAELMKARGENPAPRYTYIDGRLTAVSPGPEHESAKMRLAEMVLTLLRAGRLRSRFGGSVTLWGGFRVGNEDRKGTEPDLCYYVRDTPVLRGKKKLRMGVDPPPHLAVEVAVAHDPADQLAVLHHYHVPEVWLCQAEVVEIRKRLAGPGQAWLTLAWSEQLPFVSAAELTRWVFDPTEDDTDWADQFRAWVEAVVRPRVPPAP